MAEKHPGRYRQYAALPFALIDGELRVLLITSRETHRWILPKGWAEKNLTGWELAAKEAFEEAGIVGRVARKPIGSYTYLKRLPGPRDVACSVRVFPLCVDKLLDAWPEETQRQRQWFAVQDAAAQVTESDVAKLLLQLGHPQKVAQLHDARLQKVRPGRIAQKTATAKPKRRVAIAA